MVEGRLPPKVKRDAHDVILEFIRSRPPLKPVSRAGIRLSTIISSQSLHERFTCTRDFLQIDLFVGQVYKKCFSESPSRSSPHKPAPLPLFVMIHRQSACAPFPSSLVVLSDWCRAEQAATARPTHAGVQATQLHGYRQQFLVTFRCVSSSLAFSQGREIRSN